MLHIWHPGEVSFHQHVQKTVIHPTSAFIILQINPLTPNLQSCILNIYSTNTHTEYFNLLAPEFGI
jgi:hypothetical protein